jgi:hypothetical protein
VKHKKNYALLDFVLQKDPLARNLRKNIWYPQVSLLDVKPICYESLFISKAFANLNKSLKNEM